MAEQEVAKHVKSAYSTLTNKEHSFWYKVKEFLLEIFIIFFAVTISIWFHNWSEHLHEQKQVKVFLLGLKKDISADISDCKDLIESYKKYDTLYTYMNGLNKNKIPNLDTLKLKLPAILGNAYLRPRESRFNGFLSAGKIMTIEDDNLGLHILNYYQQTIPTLKSSESAWLNRNKALQEYMLDNVKDVDDDMSKWAVLVTPKGKYLTKYLIPWPQLYERYEALIKSGDMIIEEIDHLYPNQK